MTLQRHWYKQLGKIQQIVSRRLTVLVFQVFS